MTIHIAHLSSMLRQKKEKTLEETKREKIKFQFRRRFWRWKPEGCSWI